jgi:hypothetical protein
MPVGSDPPGGMVGTVDFSKFEGDQVVIHFGGTLATVDAYTFANSLIGFADTIRAVNKVLNPGQDIEIRLEAQGPGSYRAVIKRLKKGLGGFFSRGAEMLFWGVVATLIYEKAIKNEPPPQITVNTNEVVIQHGHDRVIVPRAVYDAMPNVRNDPEVQQNLSRTFRAMEKDESISDFGLTAHLDDAEPILVVPRKEFENLAEPTAIVGEHEKTRTREEDARLVILKAWLTHQKRKWAFEWNGVPISAPIADEAFLDRLDRREVLIGAGDALDAVMTFKQNFDDDLGVYVNDPNSYVVNRVGKHVPRGGSRRGRLL